MRIGVVGINFKTSALSLREQLSRAAQKCFSSGSSIAERLFCVLLSTCNRTEIYFSAEDLAEAHGAILASLRTEMSVAFEHNMYSYFGLDCFLHLATVTAGLDSVILAETEIQRQVKLAYERALLEYSLPSCIHFLFQKSLKIGKQVRSHCFQLPQQRSLESLIFSLGRLTVSDWKEKEVLFIGNSEINRKVISFFQRQGVRNMTLCTRSPQSAREFVTTENLPLLDWSQLNRWGHYDAVVSASTHPTYLLSGDELQEDLKTQLIFDLSVPRTVDPRLSSHPRMRLFNMESLGQLVKQKQGIDQTEVKKAEQIIWEGVECQVQIFHEKTEVLLPCAL
jgi:glutamyl-tRNA reductase